MYTIYNHAPISLRVACRDEAHQSWVNESFQLYDNVIDGLIKHKLGIKLINRMGRFLKRIHIMFCYWEIFVFKEQTLYKWKLFIATTVIYLYLDSDRTYLQAMGNRDYILCLPSNFSNLKVVHLMLFIMFTVNLNNLSTQERMLAKIALLLALECKWV